MIKKKTWKVTIDQSLEYDCHMEGFGTIGSSYLVKIISIRKIKNSKYIIKFKDAELHTTSVHGFVFADGTAKSAADLKSGDIVWIDISAFESNHTLVYISHAKYKN